MYTGMMHTHTLVVTLFLLIYLIKTFLLLSGKIASLEGFTRKTKVIEMIVSALFLVTGIYLAMHSGDLNSWFWCKLVAVGLAIPIAIIGFKKQMKSLALLSFILILYAYGVSETRAPLFKKAKPVIVANEDPMVIGSDVYMKLCQSCHGTDGKRGLSGAKDLSVSILSKEEKIQIIRHGKNAMKKYDKILSEEQINDVAEYVETFKTN